MSSEKIEKAMHEIDQISKNLQDTKVQFQDTLKKLDGITIISEDIKKILQDSRTTISDLNRERRLLEEEKQKKEAKISELTGEQQKILERYTEIEAQLKKFSTLVTQFGEKELDFDQVKAMLSIFSILLEKIFQGQPHARILYTLHGGASLMTRDQLKNTTGISGAMVLRAVHELAKAGLVEYDEDSSNVKLTVRIY